MTALAFTALTLPAPLHVDHVPAWAPVSGASVSWWLTFTSGRHAQLMAADVHAAIARGERFGGAVADAIPYTRHVAEEARALAADLRAIGAVLVNGARS